MQCCCAYIYHYTQQASSPHPPPLPISPAHAHSHPATMAFEYRTDCFIVRHGWGDARMEMSLRSITSVDGGPADPPQGAVRRCRWQCDTTVNTFIRGKHRLVFSAAAQPGAVPAVAHPARVMAEADWPRTLEIQRRHVVLTHRSIVDGRGEPTPCRAITFDLSQFGCQVPDEVSTRIRAMYEAFLRRAAGRARFLVHTTMRVVVDVIVAVDVVCHEQEELQSYLMGMLPSIGRVYLRRVAASAVEGFNVAPAAGNRVPEPTCSICLEDVAGAWRVSVTRCGHAFHLDCIRAWLVQSNLCPLCRATLRTGDVTLALPFPSPSPGPARLT